MKALYKRLREMELRTNGDPLRVQFIDQAGVERIGSVDDLESCGGDFVRVVAGSSLKDLDRILTTIRRKAEVSVNNVRMAD